MIPTEADKSTTFGNTEVLVVHLNWVVNEVAYSRIFPTLNFIYNFVYRILDCGGMQYILPYTKLYL